MLWKTHIRISNEVLHRLKVPLSSAEASSLRDGVVAPDKWEDYPHHYAKSETIRKYLLLSRKAYLQNDLPTAYNYLGVALHYIQDSYTSFPSSFSPLKHQHWEQQIEDLENNGFVNDLESTIQYTLQNNAFQRNRCSWLARELSREVQGRDSTLHIATLSGQEESKSWAKPIVDLNLAFRASLAVSRSVLSPKNCPELEATLFQVLKEYEGLLQDREVWLSNKIAELVNEREELRKQIIARQGIKIKIKNWFLSIRVRIKDFQVSSKGREYDEQKHLKDVAKRYEQATIRTISPYEGWYNFQVPRIKINIVKRELLPINEAAKNLGVDEGQIRALLQKSNYSVYHVRNKELLRRSELNKVLGESHVRNIREYPF